MLTQSQPIPPTDLRSQMLTSIIDDRTHRGGTTARPDPMTDDRLATVTATLSRVSRGEPGAAARLTPVVYDELRRLAAGYLRAERPDHTLQPTALVHEAFLRLVDQTRADIHDRSHFFAVAAQSMRRILIDHARHCRAAKRRAPGQRITLAEAVDQAPVTEVDLLRLDDALTRLAALSPRQARVVELRYFGGLTVEQAAAVLDVSPRTVKGDWRVARAWLHHDIGLEAGAP